LVDSVRSTQRPARWTEAKHWSIGRRAGAGGVRRGRWIFVPGRLDSSEVAASIAGPPWLFSRRDKTPIATIALKAYFDEFYVLAGGATLAVLKAGLATRLKK
jgi:hypothetical protein